MPPPPNMARQLAEAAHLPQPLHRGGHFLVHLEQLVDLLHGGPAALGDADLALGVDQFGPAPAPWRSSSDMHRVQPDQRLVVLRLVHRALHALHAGHHPGQRAEPAHALHLPELRRGGR